MDFQSPESGLCMYKYLVVKCDEDDNREPICLIQKKDLNKYGYGYEIYEVQKDGKLKLYKEFYMPYDFGFCVVLMHGTDDTSKWDILEKYSIDSRKNFIETTIFKKWCKKYFREDFYEIKKNILNTGSHCSKESEKNLGYAITEFEDDLIYCLY